MVDEKMWAFANFTILLPKVVHSAKFEVVSPFWQRLDVSGIETSNNIR